METKKRIRSFKRRVDQYRQKSEELKETLKNSIPGIFQIAPSRRMSATRSIFQTLACLKNARPSVAGRESRINQIP